MRVIKKDDGWYWGKSGPHATEEKAREIERAAYANGYAEDAKDFRLALDRATVRTADADGKMHVSMTPLSKANVCGYYGYEIPGSEELGLEPNKLYKLYRAPEELDKAVPTFNRQPLLRKHIAFNVSDVPKEDVVGSTGESAVFEDGYLKNSLVIWDVNSIIGVESNKKREISSSYRYRLDMTPGVSEDGEAYDGVMRDIVCNHVALVESGRAGPDVFVYDQKPTGLKLMSTAKKIMAKLMPFLASDANPDDVEKLIKDSTTEAERDNESEAERLKREERELKEREDRERRDREKDRRADDSEKDEKDKSKADDSDDEDDKEEKMAEDHQIAMDSAIKAVEARHRELRQAERDVRPHVGDLACDSSEDVYRTALKIKGCDEHATLPAAALRSVFQAYTKVPMAQDSAPSHVTRDRESAVMDMIRGGKK